MASLVNLEARDGDMIKPHKYQVRAKDFIVKNKRVFLAMDMGLGKTLTVLMAIDELKTKAVVMGPLSVILDTWPAEIEKWFPHLTYKVLHGKNKDLTDHDKYDILLLNYEGLEWFSKQTGKWKPRMLVLDESSKIKSASTSRFKILQKSFPLWSDYIVCLSATPAPNSLVDLWSQYYMLDQGKALGKNITAFRKEYCQKISYPGMRAVIYAFDERFTQQVYSLIEPRTFRLKAEDYLDMPEIVYNQVTCTLPTPVKKMYKELEKEFFLSLSSGDVEVETASTLSIKLRQLIQGGMYVTLDEGDKIWESIHDAKVEALTEIVETADSPVLCAIQFKGELEVIRSRYPKAPVIAGGVPAADRSKYIREWNEGKIPLLLCHPASLSHGVNLQSGGHILVWYGLPWSLEQYIQLNGRLYRQGQSKTVIVHHLIMKDTLDTKVLRVLQQKEIVEEGLLDYLRDATHRK